MNQRLGLPVLEINAVRVEKLVEKAIEAERQNRMDDAERLYTEVLKKDPANFNGLHGLGVVRCRQGRLEDAERLISKAVSRGPQSAHAHNNLGSVLLGLQRHEAAIKHYRQAIAITPDFADAHCNLAAALMGHGLLEEARQHWGIALRIRPDHAEAHNNLGVLLQRLGSQSASVAHFEAALKINPSYPDALNNYGAALASLGDLERALEHCSRAAKLKQDFPEAHNGMGNALLGLGRPKEAIGHFQKAIMLRPRFAEAYNNLSAAFVATGNIEGAIACLQKAAMIDTAYADPHAKLGAIYLRYGRLDEARRELARAVQLAPTNTKFLFNLAELKRFDIGDPDIELMEKMSSDPAMFGDEQRIDLHFALSKAYADFNDHEHAAQHMVKANSLKRQQVQYDEREALFELRRTEEVFTPELMERYSGAGNMSAAPIFIVGMPRSGTTLIEQILASHEHVYGADELNLLSEGVEKLPKHWGSALKYPEFAPIMTPEWLRWLGDNYVRAIESIAASAPHLTDKMPANFRFVGLIQLALPNARIIHARRDPVDTCFSCYSILFSGGQAFSYDLGELGRLYKGYERLMAHWHAVLPPGVMLDVQYEDLVKDFESVARRILAHCALDWSPACLAFDKTRRPVRTASAAQVRQPLYSKAVGRWRPYARMLQPLLDELALRS
jgi:tetratricopeptide (TPR) repeat protein